VITNLILLKKIVNIYEEGEKLITFYLIYLYT